MSVLSEITTYLHSIFAMLTSFSDVVSAFSSDSSFVRFAAQAAGVADGPAGNRGAVGHIIAAHLQTKGMIDQAKILTDFAQSLESAAALFWLFSAALGIGSFAVFGNYRQGLYLLIGPPLFFFVTQVTVPTTGTEVRFGSYTVANAPGDSSKMLNHIRAIDAETGATVEISRVFALWDAIVTEATHAVVDLLVNAENKEHLTLVARERMLNFVVQSSGDSEGYIRLVSAVHYGECASLMPHFQRTHNLRTTSPYRVGQHTSAQLSEAKAKSLFEKPGAPLDRTTKGFVIAMKNAGVKGFESVYIKSPDEQFNPSCKQIWGYIEGASKYIAQRRFTKEALFKLYRGEDISGIPWNEVITEAQNFLARMFSAEGKSDADKAYDIVAAYIYKNTLERTTLSALTSQAMSRSPFNGSEHEDVTRILAKTEAHSGFMKINYFANAIPYVQGFFLYVLSIAFPFFALFLVIPSRAASFFAWMGLWAWVKSWDVGFAAVHVARKMLWLMMQGRINVHGENLDWSDPVSVISVVYNNDPFFTENTYWMIVSTLTLAVPFVTAHFFLGATGMFDMFSGTIDQTADKFGDTERKRSRRFVANVNEHLQRVNHFRISSAAGIAHLRQGTMTPEQRAKAAKEGSVDEGAATWDGQKLQDSGNGASTHRIAHASAGFQIGHMLGMGGNMHHTNQQVQEQARAIQNGESHFLRGTIPLDAPVAPPIRNGSGEITGYDMTAMQQIYGNTATAQQMAENGVTWRQVYHRNSNYQLENQAFTASITGRRMFGPERQANNSENLAAIRGQQAQFQRDPNAAANNAALLPFDTGFVLDNLADVTKPSLEGFNVNGPAKPKD